jgi:hypothetical protein
MSRYENHIETRLATKNGLFQGVTCLKATLHNRENWRPGISQGLPGEGLCVLGIMTVS